jgi:alkaline phosphatase D
MLRAVLIGSAALALAACATTSDAPPPRAASVAVLPSPAAPETLDGYKALRPFYAQLTVALPEGPASPVLDPARPITRLAMGSCFHAIRSAAIWDAVAATRPDAFLFLGDNVYGDAVGGNPILWELRQSFARLASLPQFASFAARTPFLVTWDDHDMGLNDQGGDFAFKEFAERVHETFWRLPAEVRARPGVYHSTIVGPPGQRVQIILLDTRFFRSPLTRAEPLDSRGAYIADDNPAKTVLGPEQWAWLEAELRKPADIRLIASSIQKLADRHRFEKWANFPRERQRLFDTIARTGATGVVLLSGDRHLSAIYREQPAGTRYPLTELTASAMNMGWDQDRIAANPDYSEPGTNQVSPFVRTNNFSTLDIDWAGRTITLRTLDEAGRAQIARAIPFDEILVPRR